MQPNFFVMKIFKFGGASIKDAESVRNVANVLNHFPGEEILIVVSAMGKTTNALEQLVECYINKGTDCKQRIDEIKETHIKIINELFPADEHRVHNDVEILFMQLQLICDMPPSHGFNRVYDQIVSFGELISTKIISIFSTRCAVHSCDYHKNR